MRGYRENELLVSTDSAVRRPGGGTPLPKNTELRPDRIAAWPEKHKGDSEKKTPASRATIEASKRLQIDVQIDRHKIVSN